MKLSGPPGLSLSWKDLGFDREASSLPAIGPEVQKLFRENSFSDFHKKASGRANAEIRRQWRSEVAGKLYAKDLGELSRRIGKLVATDFSQLIKGG
jgi:hypothetical protein